MYIHVYVNKNTANNRSQLYFYQFMSYIIINQILRIRTLKVLQFHNLKLKKLIIFIKLINYGSIIKKKNQYRYHAFLKTTCKTRSVLGNA